METLKRFRLLMFFPLAAVVYVFRDVPGGTIPFTLATVVIILFWYFHSMTFALNSFRNIVVLLAGIGLILYAFGDRLSIFSTKGEIGGHDSLELNPSMIGELKTSHKVAVELFFDEKPQARDRYFKTGTFAQTDDGLHYLTKKTRLDVALLPDSKEWADKNLTSSSVAETAAAIENWWRQGFNYSLSPGAFRSFHPLDQFLFEKKTGFCQHYAAALATLLRLKGFESRVVVGYSGGSWNPVLGKLTYEDADAHAWVEARRPDTKPWIRLDPTLWVSPNETARVSDFSTIWNFGLVILGVSFLFFVLRYQSIDSRDRFIKKLEKLEKTNHLSSEGLTMAERVERLMPHPSGESLRKTLAAYHQTYFLTEPTSESRAEFSKTLRAW